jgi:hypothetical protein
MVCGGSRIDFRNTQRIPDDKRNIKKLPNPINHYFYFTPFCRPPFLELLGKYLFTLSDEMNTFVKMESKVERHVLLLLFAS